MKSPILRCSLLAALATTGCDASGPSPDDDAGVGVADAPVVVTDDAFVTEPDAFDPGAGETGRMVGMTEAHNRFRAMAATDDPLPALIWDTELAAVAQAYSEELARSGCGLMHSSTGYGENLYWQRGLTVSAADVVEGWHAEIAWAPCSCACVDSSPASTSSWLRVQDDHQRANRASSDRIRPRRPVSPAGYPEVVDET